MPQRDKPNSKMEEEKEKEKKERKKERVLKQKRDTLCIHVNTLQSTWKRKRRKTENTPRRTSQNN